MEFSNRKISSSYKLIREIGGARAVHAKGCPKIRNYDIRGMEEIFEFKPLKMNVCSVCEKLVYLASAAEDYSENYRKYADVFQNVPVSLIHRLFSPNRKRVQMVFRGNRLYIRVDRERWYLDLTLFPIGEVRLFHNNYNIKRRNDEDAAWEKTGFHEHSLPKKADPMQNSIRKIATYDYEQAKKAHRNKNKKKNAHTITFSDLDAEYWGYETDAPLRCKM